MPGSSLRNHSRRKPYLPRYPVIEPHFLRRPAGKLGRPDRFRPASLVLARSLLVSLCLPVAVGLGFEGPYHHDRLDTFYPLLPSIAIAFAASWLRARFDTIGSRLRPD